MKSNTKAPETAEEFAEDKLPENIPLMSNLEKVIGIPADVLEETAQTCKALVRKREVKTAVDLLRIVLAYAVCDWSLRFVGAWCVLLGIGFLSDVAIRKRLKNSNQWLGKLIVRLLQARQIEIRPQTRVRLRMQDATVISKPGSQGTDFRIHVSLDLGNLCLDGIEVTDEHTGETLAHYSTQPGDIRVGDRGYAFASSLGPVLASQGWLVVRANWQNLPLKTLDDQRFYFKDWLPNATQPTECQTLLETPQGSFCLRTIACPLPHEKAEEARRRVRKAAQKKGALLARSPSWLPGLYSWLPTCQQKSSTPSLCLAFIASVGKSNCCSNVSKACWLWTICAQKIINWLKPTCSARCWLLCSLIRLSSKLP